MFSKRKDNSWSLHAGYLVAMLLASALLAACGGGGGSGGGVAWPWAQGPSGSTSASDANAGTAGTSHSGGATTPAGGVSTPNAPTLREQIAALERSGAYPALDRSADIAGPDANGNGVRDDIEAWINSQQLSDAQKKALMQRGRALQKTLLVSLADQAALQVTGEGLMASSKCGGESFPKRTDFYSLGNKIEAMTANTRQRAERYMKYNAARSGSSTTYPEGNTCEP
ncbi:MAG: hypothetical protein EOO27_34060 [Comamonadaceae bacterium]|nr:MAG: hypothetical protein EOO27_34060 [Comamonadaceae bacterium]